MKFLWALSIYFIGIINLLESSCPPSLDTPIKKPQKVGVKDPDTLKLENGNYFVGKVLDHKPYGIGEYYYISPKDGTTVVAFTKMNFSSSHPPSYAGIKTSPGTYFGQFIKNLAEGLGSMNYKDGSRYSGNFHEGYPDGFGHLIFSNGYEFDGNFEMGYETVGKLLYPNGNTFTGSFVNEIPFSGTFKNPSGQIFNPSYTIQPNVDNKPKFDVNPNRPINQNRNVEQMNESAGNYQSNEDYNIAIPHSNFLKVPIEYHEKIKDKF